jgi:hypothetical protein
MRIRLLEVRALTISREHRKPQEDLPDLEPLPNPPNLAALVSFQTRAFRLAFLMTESFSVRTTGFVSTAAD